MTELAQQIPNLPLVSDVTVGNGGTCFLDARSRVWIGQDREGLLEGFEVFRAHHDGCRTTVAGDDDPVVGLDDAVDDLGEAGLDLC